MIQQTEVSFESDIIEEGLRVNRRQISRTFNFNTGITNASMGFYDGMGPRYGMQPLPFHCQGETLSPTGMPGGLQQCYDGASLGASYNQLLNALGCHKVILTDYDTLQAPSSYYVWVGTRHNTTNVNQNVAGFNISSARRTSSVTGNIRYPAFDAGLEYMSAVAIGGSEEDSTDATYPSVKNYSRSTNMTITGAAYNMAYQVFDKIADGNAVSSCTYRDSYNGAQTRGYASATEFGNYPTYGRTAQVFNLTSARLLRQYNYDQGSFGGLYSRQRFFLDTTLTNPYFTQVSSGAAATSFARVDGTTGAFSTVTTVLHNDPALTHNSNYVIVAQAAQKASAAVVIDWLMSYDSVNPTGRNYASVNVCYNMNSAFNPPPDKTTYNNSTTVLYQEDTTPVRTCWNIWPSFISGTALTAYSANRTSDTGPVHLGGANSGVLRKNTVYQFAYAVFNKLLGTETNVGTPAKVQTGNDDFVGVTFWQNLVDGSANNMQYYPASNAAASGLMAPILFSSAFMSSNNWDQFQNWLEIRIYYRAMGTFEWLPALFVPVPALFYPNYNAMWMCAGDTFGTVGGQPGGFNDYSALPADNFIDTLNYENRLFWCSDKNLYYSDQNNPFAYNSRNAVPCPQGQFRGIISHAYPGDSQQSSRVIIFGSEEIYIGQFKGASYGEQELLRVSADSSEYVFRPGSDFTVDSWTTFTSFSARSAVVADGILLYWGPKGVFADNGGTLPDRISQDVEPYIHDIYDPSRYDEINSVFNARTKEVVWFYPPRPGTTTTSGSKALVFNVKKQAFYLWDFGETIVDWAQPLEVLSTHDANRGLDGQRVIAGIRDAVSISIPQRVVFFDERCQVGDLRPGRMWMVKTVTDIGGNQYDLTLATGFSPNPNTLVSLGDTAVIRNYNAYRNSLTPAAVDALYTVTDVTASKITVQKTNTAVDWPATGTITNQSNFFPLGVNSVQNFDYVLDSNYWAPGGMKFWGRWLYCHALYKIAWLPAQAATSIGYPIKHSYLSLIGGDTAATGVYNMTDNSRTYYQLHGGTQQTQVNTEGQGIRFKQSTFTGKHFAGSYFLQYIGFDALPLAKDQLKHWEPQPFPPT